MLKRVQKVTYEIVNEEGEEVSTDDIFGFKTKNGYSYVFDEYRSYLIELDESGHLVEVYDDMSFPSINQTMQEFIEDCERWLDDKIVEFYDDCRLEFAKS